ncbi:MAG TPA: Ty1/Copia family ribonuclease HI [Candidatus Brocadiales bacterium]|nr:Ty1/Copia family ribonuclease HI [Candidatus Brocadiales bacterium]
MVCTRPDISFAVCNAARYMHDPGISHWESVKRIFRFLKGTINKGIVYKKTETGKINLHVEVDASWASNDLEKSRSDAGYIAFINNAPISWKCMRQKAVAQSSTEAEYMAAAAAAKEAVWLRRLLMDLRQLQKQPTVINEDNRGCIALSSNPVNHEKNKHVQVKFHYTREAVDKGEVILVYKSTQDIIADIMTKPMDVGNFRRCSEALIG